MECSANYDFVAIIESSDNAGIARFSLEMGVAAGVHITTLPAIPIARFEAPNRDDEFDFEDQLSSPTEGDTVGYGTLASTLHISFAGCGKIRIRQFDATG